MTQSRGHADDGRNEVRDVAAAMGGVGPAEHASPVTMAHANDDQFGRGGNASAEEDDRRVAMRRVPDPGLR
eukprot:58143-Alexandrium_andersonii.AAC.1